jgi:YfiR/HmsC-like
MAVLRRGKLIAIGYVIFLAAAQGQVQEYHVKAAFLYNLVKFVEWPAPSFHSSTSPMIICVLGRDPFAGALTETVEGKMLGGRGLLVQPIPDAQRANHCQIVFVSSSEQKRFPLILRDLKANGILTVGDTEGFASQGGVVNFKLEGGMVRFEINLDAAKEKNLRISSKLLSLAQIVKYSEGAR